MTEDSGLLNRIHNSSNPHQGDYKRVLCVCSAGLLRSPTAAWVLSQEPYGFNTRAAGIDFGHALVKVDTVLLSWADEIVVMNDQQGRQVEELGKNVLGFKTKPLHILNIPDVYAYRHPELIRLIRERVPTPIVSLTRVPVAQEVIDE